jgi:hypothetical protein
MLQNLVFTTLVALQLEKQQRLICCMEAEDERKLIFSKRLNRF